METESSEDSPSTDIPTEELRIKSRLAANTRSRQRCGLLSPFYYILATLTFMFEMVHFSSKALSASGWLIGLSRMWVGWFVRCPCLLLAGSSSCCTISVINHLGT